MFSNRFNTKNDPLLEAVQNAMQDGAIRRQAEAYVNEQFGVYSRKAVVREHLADYDAALEEAYADLKEGYKDLAKKSLQAMADKAGTGAFFSGGRPKSMLTTNGLAKSALKDMAAKAGESPYKKKKNVKEETKLAKKDYDAALEEAYADLKEGYKDLAKKSLQAMADKAGTGAFFSGGRPKSMLTTNGLAKSALKDMAAKAGESPYKKKKNVKEETKLAKKDYDKDGKIESPKDEVWGSRLRAAKMAGKMVEEQMAPQNRFNLRATSVAAQKATAGARSATRSVNTNSGNIDFARPQTQTPTQKVAPVTGTGSVSIAPGAGTTPAARPGLSPGKLTLPPIDIGKTGVTAPASSTPAPKPAPAPVKSVQTKGGAFPVFSKGSEAAAEFKKAYAGAAPGSTFKWKASGETGPEREYKAAPVAKTAAATTSVAPASTATTPRQAGAPDETSTQKFLSQNLGDRKSTPAGPEAPVTGTDPGSQENIKRRSGGPLEESVVNVGSNKYRIV